MSRSNIVYSGRDFAYLPEYAEKSKTASASVRMHLELWFQVSQKYCRFSSKGKLASSNIGGVLNYQRRVNRRTSHESSGDSANKWRNVSKQA